LKFENTDFYFSKINLRYLDSTYHWHTFATYHQNGNETFKTDGVEAIFASGVSTPPLDIPTSAWISETHGLGLVLYIIAGLVILILLGIIAVTLRRAGNKLIRASSTAFLILILIGCCLGTASIFTLYVSLNLSMLATSNLHFLTASASPR